MRPNNNKLVLYVVLVMILLLGSTIILYLGLIDQSVVNSVIFNNFNKNTGGSIRKEVQTRKTEVRLNSKFNIDVNPAVQPLEWAHRATTAMAAKFRSLSPNKIQIWYEDGAGGVDQGHLTLGQETTTNTYEGHVFFFTEFGHKDIELARFTMTPDKVLYVVQDPNVPAPEELQRQNEAEEEFMREYFERTGVHWRHFYGPQGPRPPPVLHMWPADQVGDVHSVTSAEGYWLCEGSSTECQSVEPVTLELEVISLAPRAFIVPNFLNDYEAEEIVRLASPHMKHSIVGDYDSGAFESSTRTSRNTWVVRSTNAISESLFLRAADLLQIDEGLLHKNANAEDLQVVHYVNGQKYDSHHDWGVSGYVESRYITLLLYLTDMAGPNAGGETSFPKGADGKGIKVHPGKGSAVLFYNLLPDGNGDDLALHAALPVHQGEKWLANFWVWDPKFKNA